MGPRIKFKVEPKAIEMLEKQLITNDLGGRKRIKWMIFQLGSESWDLLAYGEPTPDFFDKIVAYCPKDEGRQIMFRSADDKTDVWIKYIPDEASTKEKTHFATGSDSLFENCRTCKVKLEIRDHVELSKNNPDLAKYVT